MDMLAQLVAVNQPPFGHLGAGRLHLGVENRRSSADLMHLCLRPCVVVDPNPRFTGTVTPKQQFLYLRIVNAIRLMSGPVVFPFTVMSNDKV